MEMMLEVVVLPVSDVDRAKKFYTDLGWRLDADISAGDKFRVVQVTPPGSHCSVQFGKGVTLAAPGSAQGLFLVVSDIEAARAELVNHGAQVGKAFHRGENWEPVTGRDPQRRSYFTYASFVDPDGNQWLLQEITQRLPGRVEAETTFSSTSELAAALRRAEVAHGQHEAKLGHRDENWPEWYAQFMIREQKGEKQAA